MKDLFRLLLLLTLGLLALTVVEAWAQPIATLRWQFQPYCNVVTLNVTAQGAIFTLDGYDDQCGAAQRASVVGSAFLNPDGSVGIGLNTVLAPGGAFVHAEARLSLTSLGGPWRDSVGNSGTFVLTPGAATGGGPRPVAANGIAPGSIGSGQLAPGIVGAAQIDAGQVQRRVSGICSGGQAVRSIGADGSVICGTTTVNLGYEIVTQTPAVPPGAHTRVVSCPSGKRAVGGGYDSIGLSMTVLGSWPTSTGDGWRVIFNNVSSLTFGPGIHAICVVVQ